MQRKLAAFPSGALQRVSLLIAFVLLFAAKDFAVAHPASAAGLVFIFSLPYLVASVVTRRAHHLYGTMLLGAFSYFLACHALGAPGSWFPVLAVPLVVGLWLVGRLLVRRLGPELRAFPLTTWRALNITVVVFACWALAGSSGTAAAGGVEGFVPAVAYAGYAGLYLAHLLCGAHMLYAYVFSLFAGLAGVFVGVGVWSWWISWLPLAVAAVGVFAVGVRGHRPRGYGWSRHLYLCGAALLVISLFFSLSRWEFWLLDLVASALVLWVTHGLLGEAVGGVQGATVVERGVAKALFVWALALLAPLAVAVVVAPERGGVAIPALAGGVLLSWVGMRRRRESRWGLNPYFLGAMLLVSAGLSGAASLLPRKVASVWLVAMPVGFFLATGWLWRRLSDRRDAPGCSSLACGMVFPAFFGWRVALASGQPGGALAVALAAAFLSPAMAIALRDSGFFYGLGPAAAGVVVSGLLLGAWPSATAWVGSVVAAIAAAAWFVVADAKGQAALRVAGSLCWSVLTVASVVLAGAFGGASSVLCGLTVLAPTALVVSGLRWRRGGRDAWDKLNAFTGLVLAAGVVVWGPLSGWSLAQAGASVVVVAVGYGCAWGLSLREGYARGAAGLFAFGMVLVVYGMAEGVGTRLATGTAIVAALFAAALAAMDRFPGVGRSVVVVGHVTAVVLMLGALAQSWGLEVTRLALAGVPYVVLYAVAPRLRGRPGFRLGALGWLSFVVLFVLARGFGTPYPAQAQTLVFLAPVLLMLGYLLRTTAAGDWSVPLYACGALVAGFCGLVALLGPANWSSWRVFLVGGIVFTTMFVMFRHEGYAYLLTLSLALLGYEWVKASTSQFTQDLLFYLVIGAGLLGAFFLLPLLKRAADRLGTLPVFSVFTWRGAALTSVPVFCGGVVVVGAYLVKITEHPKFCTSCHYMGDYYASWQHSSHKNVACVECHYEPGVEAELEGKLAGLVQLVKYVSHAYGNRPHALISNRSCMRVGCHAAMDHNKQTLLFEGKIKFRHERHLSGHPRGKELNCVSCHGQMVEGQHISVTKTTCLTCHFYGRGDKAVAAGNCQTCHPIPQRTVSYAGQSFNHREFLKGKGGVRCVHCHARVTQGEGVVSPTRCQSCHLRSKGKVEVRDQARFHLMHVSKGHFDCLQCHDEIRHGKGLRPHEMMASGKCATCHGSDRHSLQERVYAGSAVEGMKPEPDAMYKAGVACAGCHVELKVMKVGTADYVSRVSGSRPCADCHGEADYAEMLAEWQNETKARLRTLQPALAELRKLCQTGRAPGENVRKARALLAAAGTEVACVVDDGSYGAHNYAYVSSLLDRVEAELRECRSVLGAAANSRGSGE